jgi:hypothetical protein
VIDEVQADGKVDAGNRNRKWVVEDGDPRRAGRRHAGAKVTVSMRMSSWA